MKIKLNNYYFDSTEDISTSIDKVIINENINLNIKLDSIKYEEDYVEDGIRQFTITYFDTPLAIMSLMTNVIEDKLIINYQKISRNGE